MSVFVAYLRFQFLFSLTNISVLKMNCKAHHNMCNLHDTIIFFMRHASLKLPSIHVYIRFYSTQKKDLSCTALASVHRIGLANCRRRSLTIMTSRTIRTQLHPSGTKASSGVFEDQEHRDFQKTFITQRVHCMCWHNARWYKKQYSLHFRLKRFCTLWQYFVCRKSPSR